MSQMKSGTLHIGLSSCHDWHDKLKFEYVRLVSSQYKEKYDILNFIITAYHLNDDWLSKDTKTRPKLANSKRGSAPSEMREIVQAIKDLANGNKHMELDKRSSAKRVVGDVQSSARESSFYSYFLGPHFGIPIGGKSFYIVPTFADLIMNYFEWIFDDSIPANNFPEKLSESLARASERRYRLKRQLIFP